MQTPTSDPDWVDPPPTELTIHSDAIDTGLNDSDLGDPSGAGTTSAGFTDGARRWEEAVARARDEGADPLPPPDGLDAGPALLCGLIGALAVTGVNEAARRLVPRAPRLDELGIRGLAKALREAGQEPPSRDRLFWLSMAGDLASNALYYSLAARAPADGVLRRGVLLGVAAGVGAVLLPAPMGLGRGPTARSPQTRVLTVTWYLLGGLAAVGAARLLRKK